MPLLATLGKCFWLARVNFCDHFICSGDSSRKRKCEELFAAAATKMVEPRENTIFGLCDVPDFAAVSNNEFLGNAGLARELSRADVHRPARLPDLEHVWRERRILKDVDVSAVNVFEMHERVPF